MINWLLNNPAWIAAVGGLMSATVGVANYVMNCRDRRAASARALPLVSLSVRSIDQQPGWWRLGILVHNTSLMPLTIDQIEVEKPRDARIATGKATDAIALTPETVARRAAISIVCAGADDAAIQTGFKGNRYNLARSAAAAALYVPPRSRDRMVRVALTSASSISNRKRMVLRASVVVPASSKSEKD